MMRARLRLYLAIFLLLFSHTIEPYSIKWVLRKQLLRVKEQVTDEKNLSVIEKICATICCLSGTTWLYLWWTQQKPVETTSSEKPDEDAECKKQEQDQKKRKKKELQLQQQQELAEKQRLEKEQREREQAAQEEREQAQLRLQKLVQQQEQEPKDWDKQLNQRKQKPQKHRRKRKTQQPDKNELLNTERTKAKQLLANKQPGANYYYRLLGLTDEQIEEVTAKRMLIVTVVQNNYDFARQLEQEIIKAVERCFKKQSLLFAADKFDSSQVQQKIRTLCELGAHEKIGTYDIWWEQLQIARDILKSHATHWNYIRISDMAAFEQWFDHSNTKKFGFKDMYGENDTTRDDLLQADVSGYQQIVELICPEFRAAEAKKKQEKERLENMNADDLLDALLDGL